MARPHLGQPESRLAAILDRLHSGGPVPISRLATELGIAKQTLSHCVKALRERGHDVHTVRGPEGWEYVLAAGEGEGRSP